MKEYVQGPVLTVLFLMLAGISSSVLGQQTVAGTQSAALDVEMSQSGNVSVDFKDADIRNVLKVLAYKSGVNIIAAPEVVGQVSIQLKDVPWQKALDVILSTYGYSYEQDGKILMVTTIDNLKKRRENMKALAEQELVISETFVLNYGKAEEVRASIDKMKSPRGSIHWDKRMNAIIVSDVETSLRMIRAVIKELDTVTPQVYIEAKMIETTLNKSENLGIDWNVVASVTGPMRATTYPFTGNSQNKYTNSPDFPVSTDEVEPFFQYGTLDLTKATAMLNMLKSRADTNIVSNPKIVTLNNQTAKIVVGSQYPVPQYTYNSDQGKMQVSGWNYIDIGVVFVVTPHVNNAGMVTLDLEPTVTDILDYVQVEGTQMPRLSTESARTTVMIADGDTLVIAGLIKTKKGDTRKKFPILGDIPILGLPFQSKIAQDQKTDLVIFMTPKIVTPVAAGRKQERVESDEI